MMLAAAATVSVCGHAVARLVPVDNQTLQVVVPAQGHSSVRDAVVQLVSTRLAEKLQRKLQVSNQGSTAVGVEAAAKAPADGSTLLFAWGEILSVPPTLKGAAQTAQEFEPVILVGEAPNILVVNNDLPVHNLAQFTEYVRSHPGVVNFGSIGNGSYMHLAGVLYMNSTDTNMVHVPYSAAGLATSNLISGEIQSMFQLVPSVLEALRAGKLKALGVMSPRRSRSLPDVPTMAEQGHPELESANWFALLAPKGTPPETIFSVNAAVNEILQEPEVRDRLIDLGVEPLGGAPDVLQQRILTEQKKWNRIINMADMAIR
jgi:tripartite-type tricarboxylate transporter receptor subunit TctC